MEISIKLIPYMGLILTHFGIGLAYMARGKRGLASGYFAASVFYLAIAANAFAG